MANPLEEQFRQFKAQYEERSPLKARLNWYETEARKRFDEKDENLKDILRHITDALLAHQAGDWDLFARSFMRLGNCWWRAGLPDYKDAVLIEGHKDRSRKAHEAAHGTPEQKQARYDEYQKKLEEEHDAYPIRGITALRESVAKYFSVSNKTIQRNTKITW